MCLELDDKNGAMLCVRSLWDFIESHSERQHNVCLTFMNCYYVKLSTRVQDVCTFAKLAALTLIIVTGAVQLGRGEIENFKDPFEYTKTNIATVSLAFHSGLFAYNGWNNLNYVIEELQDPVKNCPKAIWISISLCTVLYTFANVAYFTTVSRLEFLSCTVVLMFTQRIHVVMRGIMPIFVLLSTIGGANGILFTTSRLFYVGGRFGHMPQILSMVSVNRLTPMPAVLFMGLLSLLYLTLSNIYTLITYVSFVNWLATGLSVTVLLYLRRKKPNMIRPVKVALFWPILYVAISFILVLLSLISSPKETGFGCLIISIGIPVYFVFVYWENKPNKIVHFLDKITCRLQKLLICVPEDKKVE